MEKSQQVPLSNKYLDEREPLVRRKTFETEGGTLTCDMGTLLFQIAECLKLLLVRKFGDPLQSLETVFLQAEMHKNCCHTSNGALIPLILEALE